jgi:prolyl 4-hydroxylase
MTMPAVHAARAATEHFMALDAAEGRGVPQDWEAALDHLRHSAELGFVLAQSSLAALAGDWTTANRIATGETQTRDWQALRKSVDIGVWTRIAQPKILSASPRVALVENIASPEVCDWLTRRARPRLTPAKVFDSDTGGSAHHEGARNNSECHFGASAGDLILSFLRRRIALATELPVAAMEATAILHYTPGQQFLPHLDFLDTSLPGYAKEVAGGGQRVVTLLLCLNDDYEGGETEFPQLGKRFKGRRGNALFFWNVEPDGTPDKRTVHAGLPPTRGEKWMLSQWIRERVWRGATAPTG